MTEYETRLFLCLVLALCLIYMLRMYRALYLCNEAMATCLSVSFAEILDLRAQLAKKVQPDGVPRTE